MCSASLISTAVAIGLVVFAFVPACKKSDPPRADPDAATFSEQLVAETNFGTLKLYAIRSGLFRVWLNDKSGKPLGENVEVSLKLDIDGYPEVTLTRQGDYFQGKGPEILSEHANAIITTRVAGASEITRIRLHMESGAAEPHRERR